MARKDAMMNLRQILVRRRDALRQALAGDLSLLKELRQQNSGDVIDAALDTAQDEISSQIAEVESRELSNIETALERMRHRDDVVGRGARELLDEGEDRREASHVHGQLRLGDLEAGEMRDVFDVAAGQRHERTGAEKMGKT